MSAMPRRSAALALWLAAASLLPAAGLAQETAPAPATGAPVSLALGGFRFEDEVVVPGTPEEAFKAFTEETLSWWDHRFSQKSVKLYFDTKPGGGFWEIFDAEGHGARHATVILADPPRRLRFTGPLGLSGNAIEMVHTLDFEAAGPGRTRVKLLLNAVGQVEKGWPEIVQKTWHHFLDEAFRPYMEKKAAK